MCDDKKIFAKKVASLLRAIAEKIEKNPEFLDDLNLSIEEIPASKKKKKINDIEINVFEIYSKKGEDGLIIELRKLNTSQLKDVIRKNSFDPTKLSDKWRKKDKLIDLIVHKVKSRVEKGQVFRDYN